MTGPEFHPLADAFPLLDEKGLIELAHDIKTNGLRHPIMMFDDQILDGRNRFRACLMVNVPPRFERFTGDWSAARAYVVSENLIRRHLSTSQKAMIAARLAKLPMGWRATYSDDPSAAELAQKFAITRSTVQAGKRVIRDGVPELVRAVDDGQVRVFTAKRISQLPPDEQRQAIQYDTGHRSNSPDHVTSGLDRCVSTLEAYARVRVDEPAGERYADELAALRRIRTALSGAFVALRKSS